MTISGWVILIILGAIIVPMGGFLAYICIDSSHVASGIATIFATLVIVAGLYNGIHWYYTGTEAGKRALVDERSDLRGGLKRSVRVYTANGDVIAEYDGKIDIDANEGGYVKFDYDGKRYIYYNCFVESIAELPE